MFFNKTHLLKDSLDQTYAFTTWPRVDAEGFPDREAIPRCRTYGRQTLDSIVESFSDPFHHHLLDLWLDVYQKPWARPATLEKLLSDLAIKIGTGELRVYREDAPHWHHVSGPDAGETLSGEDAASERVDVARVQAVSVSAAPVRKDGNADPDPEERAATACPG